MQSVPHDRWSQPHERAGIHIPNAVLNVEIYCAGLHRGLSRVVQEVEAEGAALAFGTDADERGLDGFHRQSARPEIAQHSCVPQRKHQLSAGDSARHRARRIGVPHVVRGAEPPATEPVRRNDRQDKRRGPGRNPLEPRAIAPMQGA